MRHAFIVAALGAILATGCLGQTPAAKMQETARDLNMNARFGRMELVVEQVTNGYKDEFVKRNTKSFSTHLAGFCKMALEKKWVEAEDRAGKAGGAFCTGMGPFRQTRVFMTYTGTYDNLSTLAHELGHAYHSFVLNHKPFFASIYPMTLAETASIFTESVVTDAALSATTDREERLDVHGLSELALDFLDEFIALLVDRILGVEELAAAVLLDHHRKHFFDPLVGRVATLAARAHTAAVLATW